MKSMIKRLIGYILAAAIVAVLVYTILGREGYTSLWPHAGNSESTAENHSVNPVSRQIEVPVQAEERTPAEETTPASPSRDSLKSPDKPAADTPPSDEVDPTAGN